MTIPAAVIQDEAENFLHEHYRGGSPPFVTNLQDTLVTFGTRLYQRRAEMHETDRVLVKMLEAVTGEVENVKQRKELAVRQGDVSEFAYFDGMRDGLDIAVGVMESELEGEAT